MSNSSTANRPAIQAPIGVPGRPWIRTTYQLVSAIPAPAQSIDEKFVDAYKCVLRWVKGKSPSPLPQSAWDGESFHLEWPGQKIEGVSIPDIGVWAFRFEHPDTPFGDRPAVPGRTWTVDIGFRKSEEQIGVGVRCFCASLPYANADIAMKRPRVVVELATRLGLTDLRPLVQDAWRVGSEEELQELEEFLCDTQRRLPVVMLTQPDKKRFSIDVSEYVLDPQELAKRLLGLAHVVKLPWEIGYEWTNRVGKPWSAYLGAVRTYMPGLDFELDLPALHPATLADKIVFWKQPGDDRIGEAPFTDFLVERLFQQMAAKRLTCEGLPFVPEARTKRAKFARSKATESDDWRQLYEDQISALEKTIEEREKEAEEYNDDAIRSTKERDYYKDENRQLRYQIEPLRLALKERSGADLEQETTIPDSYEELPEWVEQHLAGQLVLHSRALRGLKDARYEDVGLVFKSLLLLANEYRKQCLSYEGANEAFAAKLQELGLRFDRSISRERAGEQGDQYFVRFPPGFGLKHFLEWHLRKGTTKDDRLCMGIYLFWDEDTQQVVVGWLPSHLDNRMT